MRKLDVGLIRFEALLATALPLDCRWGLREAMPAGPWENLRVDIRYKYPPSPMPAKGNLWTQSESLSFAVKAPGSSLQPSAGSVSALQAEAGAMHRTVCYGKLNGLKMQRWAQWVEMLDREHSMASWCKECSTALKRFRGGGRGVLGSVLAAEHTHSSHIDHLWQSPVAVLQ